MPLAGKVIIPREIAHQAKAHWANYELTKAIAVALGESAGTLGAYHDNEDAHGNVTSRDCGLYQINISFPKIGTEAEFELRTESLDPIEYEPVMLNNLERARALYDSPWLRDGERATRLWQPWVAYTQGWATFPEFWIWHQDAEKNPVGPWVKTGRYIQRAISGQMNFHLQILKDWTAEQALFYGKRYAKHFNVNAELRLSKKEPFIVGFDTPPIPTEPPADGVGPRPQENDGQ